MHQESLNYTNAVWDDGEWLSWAEINRFIKEPPKVEISRQKQAQLESLIAQARKALERSENIGGRIGEMGELYAEARFRIKRHRRRYAQGSDGKLGDDFVEVKTISPWKKTPEVRVKRSGHWSWLVVVKISEQWTFEAMMLSRADLGPGNGGKHVKVRWGDQEQRVEPAARV